MAFPPFDSDNPNPGEMVGIPVIIQEGSVTPDDADGKYETADADAGVWTDYKVNNRYEKDHHKYMVGMTAPYGFGGSSGSRRQCVSFVQLAHPTLLWVVEWTACRYLFQPVAPSPYIDDPDWVLMDEHYEPFMITVGPDGVSPLYRLSGVYVYGHTCPDDVTVNDINYPRPPWLQDVFDRTQPTSSLQSNLSNLQGQPAGRVGGNGGVGRVGG